MIGANLIVIRTIYPTRNTVISLHEHHKKKYSLNCGLDLNVKLALAEEGKVTAVGKSQEVSAAVLTMNT